MLGLGSQPNTRAACGHAHPPLESLEARGGGEAQRIEGSVHRRSREHLVGRGVGLGLGRGCGRGRGLGPVLGLGKGLGRGRGRGRGSCLGVRVSSACAAHLLLRAMLEAGGQHAPAQLLAPALQPLAAPIAAEARVPG